MLHKLLRVALTTLVFVGTSAALARSPVWRLSRDLTGHFYTASCEEGNYARGEYKMLWELAPNPAFFVEGSEAPGAIPLYRFFNGVHFFYASENAEGAPGFVSQDILGYIYPSPIDGTIPLYRSYNLASFDHFYTTDKSEWERSFGSYTMDHEIIGYVPASGPIECSPSEPKLKVYQHESHESVTDKFGDSA